MQFIGVWLFNGLVWLFRDFFWKIVTVGFIGSVAKIFVAYSLIQVILALGIGAVTYVGTSFTLDWVVVQMASALSGIPYGDVLNFVATKLRLDECLTIIFTALSISLSLSTFKKTFTTNL